MLAINLALVPTCHVIVREGFDSLNETTDDEDDMLDKSLGLEVDSRLSCHVKLAREDWWWNSGNTV